MSEELNKALKEYTDSCVSFEPSELFILREGFRKGWSEARRDLIKKVRDIIEFERNPAPVCNEDLLHNHVIDEILKKLEKGLRP